MEKLNFIVQVMQDFTRVISVRTNCAVKIETLTERE